MKRVRIIIGHYGSGKTEYAVNLALSMAAEGLPTTLADLDIVNPYFRSYEQGELLRARGVRLIVSSCGGRTDLPAIPAEVLGIFEDESTFGVLDMGGDPAGAHLLGRFAPHLARTDFDLLFVLNANRPETRDCERALAYLRAIETSAKQRVTGIVNNTHLCGETTAKDIQKGANLAGALCEATGIPVVRHIVERRLTAAACEALGPDAPLFPIDIHMKKPWEL